MTTTAPLDQLADYSMLDFKEDVSITYSHRTGYRATQKGRASRAGEHPKFPKPLWPDRESMRLLTVNPAEASGDGVVSCTIEWQYTFASAEPLVV